MTIHIIQPAIPKYRIPLFEKLKSQYEIRFYAAKFDFLGVETVYSTEEISISSGFFSFFNSLYWHKKLPFLNAYQKNDIVIINGNPRVLNYMLLFVLLRMRGIKCVWWGHGWTAGSYGISAKIRMKMMKLADAVVVYTDREKERIPLRKCFALNNGLDFEQIQNVISCHPLKKAIPNNIFYFVFIGRITSKSNLKLLLSALSKTQRNIHLNIIGTGDEISSLKKLSNELLLTQRVHWYGAIFDENKLAEVMLSSHAFVYTGSVGLSLIHAFNYSLPALIHSDEQHHMPEFAAFEEGVNGVSFVRDDETDLILKLETLPKLNTYQYNEMSKNALNTVKKSFNTSDMACRLSSVIEGLNNK